VTASFEAACRFQQRRSGGSNVVEQQHAGGPDLLSSECSAHVLKARFARQAGLDRGLTYAPEPRGLQRNTQRRRQRPSQQSRGVPATLAQLARMKRHGDYGIDVPGIGRRSRCQQRRQVAQQVPLVGVLEAPDRVSQRPLVQADGGVGGGW
jgi:hypothetical protein